MLAKLGDEELRYNNDLYNTICWDRPRAGISTLKFLNPASPDLSDGTFGKDTQCVQRDGL